MFDLNEQEQKKFNKIFMNNLIIDNMFPSNRTPLGNNWLLDNAIFSYIWAKGSSPKKYNKKDIQAERRAKRQQASKRLDAINNASDELFKKLMQSKNPLLFPFKAFCYVIGGTVLFVFEKLGWIEKAE